MFKRYLYRQYRLFPSTGFWLQRRFTKAGLMVVAGVIGMAARADTNLSVGYQAFCVLFGLLLVGLAGCRFSRARFTARRILPRMVSVGAPLTYRVVLENPSNRPLRDSTLMEDLADPRPTLQEFIDNPEPGEEQRNWFDRTFVYYRWRWLMAKNRRGKIKEQPAPALPPHGRVDIQFELLPLRRGFLRFESLTMACPDPLGLCRALVKYPLPDSLLVLPKRYATPALALPGTLKYQAGGIALASSVGESEEFVALRDYRSGDPLSDIHWKSWAKIGKPIVKEFQDEFFVRHALILDTFCPSEFSDIFEEAVSVAASFACTVQTQDSLLDLLFVGPQAYCFTVGRGLAHTDQMLEILASVKTCREQPFRSLHQLVLRHSAAVSGCVCVFIQWDKERQELVKQLKAMGVPLLVLVITEDGAAVGLDAGPLRESPECFHALEKSKIAEGLARMG